MRALVAANSARISSICADSAAASALASVGSAPWERSLSRRDVGDQKRSNQSLGDTDLRIEAPTLPTTWAVRPSL